MGWNFIGRMGCGLPGLFSPGRRVAWALASEAARVSSTAGISARSLSPSPGRPFRGRLWLAASAGAGPAAIGARSSSPA